MAAGNRVLRVMTLNVYFGTDLEPAYKCKELPELVATLGRLWQEVLATDIPARASIVAREIAKAKPDIIGLQELARWSTGSPGAMNIECDFLELILAALRSAGVPYLPISMRKDLDSMGPLDMSGKFVRMEDRHAVLMRADSASRIVPFDIIGGPFTSIFRVTSPVVGELVSPRSWIAVDAIAEDAKFRLVESHLESTDFDIQLAQTRELIAGPAETSLPLIFIGDINSNANLDSTIPDYSDSYPEMIKAGFKDAWSVLNPSDLGYTCCQAADLTNRASTLDRRIDVILTRGAVTPISAELVLADPSVRTPSGVWPTDHAGILATLRID